MPNWRVSLSIVAVRNDRNKRRKPKQDGCVTSQQSEELTSEEESLIEKIVKAHEETFNSKADEDKFKVRFVHNNELGEFMTGVSKRLQNR